MLSELGIDAEHRGDRWVAKCPSGRHEDKNPSWDIMDTSDDKHGLHVCRSCDYGGTATELVSDQLEITFHGAREWIAERCLGQAPIPRSIALDIDEAGWKFRLPPEVVVAPMDDWPEVARQYLLNRAIRPEQATRWGLGYAVVGRLAGRIVVPSRDALGRVRNYTARSFTGHAKRYKEPKAAEGPDEGAIFGEQHWPAKDERSLVVVTEGALNALAVERVARVPIASLFGSTVKLEHVVKLATFGRALLLTDPDMAGDRAAEKIVQALVRHVTLQRVVLPKGTDADSVEPALLRAQLVESWRELERRRHKKG